MRIAFRMLYKPADFSSISLLHSFARNAKLIFSIINKLFQRSVYESGQFYITHIFLWIYTIADTLGVDVQHFSGWLRYDQSLALDNQRQLCI